jgi:hypothetical protein
MPSAPANHDPALPHPLPGNSLSSAPQGAPSNIGDGDVSASQLGGLDSNQMMAILRHLPGVLNKVCMWNTLNHASSPCIKSRSHAPRDHLPSSRFFDCTCNAVKPASQSAGGIRVVQGVVLPNFAAVPLNSSYLIHCSHALPSLMNQAA